MPETILIERPRGGVGLIRLNRPDRLNALNQTVFDELTSALADFAANDGIRVVVITGSERAFAAGADVQEMRSRSAAQARESGEKRLKQWQAIAGFSKPLIAAINGWCLGGGNELALSCDLLVAGENATFGQPEINLAIMPGAGGTQRLTRAVGKVVAMEMVLAGRFLSAWEAKDYQLVNHVTPIELTLEKALDLAETIARQAPIAVREAKQAVLQAFETALAEGLRYERDRWYALFDTEDQEEGIRAFLEKRSPQWKGQ